MMIIESQNYLLNWPATLQIKVSSPQQALLLREGGEGGGGIGGGGLLSLVNFRNFLRLVSCLLPEC